jgi:hypothetical protein
VFKTGTYHIQMIECSMKKRDVCEETERLLTIPSPNFSSNVNRVVGNCVGCSKIYWKLKDNKNFPV